VNGLQPATIHIAKRWALFYKTGQMNEKDFVSKKVIPLLKTLGFEHVRYLHGIDEFGRDIIFYDNDRFGIEKLFCAQVKVGDISGGSKSIINEITSQIDDAFKMPYYDSFRNESKYVSGLYIITSGKYTRNAKEKIKEKVKGLPTYFLDKNDFENIDLKFTNSKDISKKEKLISIKREILAEARCDNIDYHFIERKLNEIDLHENYFTEDKIEILSDIGLEITLNSKEGTELLVKQLLWYLTTGYFINKSYLKLLASIITILWTWGVQAVEYQRNIESVKIILGALKEIIKKVHEIKNNNLINQCNEVVKNMIYQAEIDNHIEIKEYIVNEMNK